MVKVKISWQGQTVDFDLNRDLPLPTIIDAICTQLNVAPPKSDYSLQVDNAPQHISQQVRRKKIFRVLLAEPRSDAPFSLVHPFR
jgi:predicted alpha/beta hydrolase family esterase